MKGLGNYSIRPQTERRLGTLLLFRGAQAVVRFHNGETYALPAEPMRRVGIVTGARFVLLVTRAGGNVTEVRVERPPEARVVRPYQPAPAKVVVRDGRKMVTRK